VKRLALLDVCDVCVDLHRVTIERANLKLDTANVTDWDIFNLISDEECERVVALFNNQDFWRTLPPVPGVHEGVEGLRSQGYDIHFLTSPWFTCENWEGIRRAWLAEQFPWFKPLDMTTTSEKFRFDGDLLIDDRPKHVRLWQLAHPGKVAYLFDSPFNRFFSWKTRCTWQAGGIKLL
jgi:5'(3')-deoxyribonucleotidase